MTPIPSTEWWQRGPVPLVPDMLQPVAHILLQVGESVPDMVRDLSTKEWNARPAGIASAAFHVRHIIGVIDRLFTYARGDKLTDAQFEALRHEADKLDVRDASALLSALDAQIETALQQLRATPPDQLAEFRAVGRAKLPSTVIGCLVHGAEHSMRHVGQLSVTVRVVRSSAAT
jgi:uncharacterized damage-inducible protein DinB